MKVTVRLFASVRDSLGADRITIDVPEGARVADLVERLTRRYPAAEGHAPSWNFAVNQVHAEPDTVLHAGDRVAIFPYVAGG